jgi:hypothetical protein
MSYRLNAAGETERRFDIFIASHIVRDMNETPTDQRDGIRRGLAASAPP